MKDGLVSRVAHLRMKIWWKGPSLESLDETGCRLYFRSGDLCARLCLNGEAVALWDAGEGQASCTLIHAERYLADRLAYELAPWPKGMIKDEDAVERALLR